MIIIGVLLGLGIFVLSLLINIRVIKKARNLPPQEASRHLVIRYVIKIAILLLFLGGLTYWMGKLFVLGVLGGMVLGILLFLVVSRTNRSFIERLIKGPEERY